MTEKKKNEFLALKLEEGRICIKFKMILIGITSAGKSTFLSRIISEKFFKDTRATLGAEFFTKKLRLDNIEVVTHIWDLSGSERYALQLPFYSLGARGAIIMFDLTRKKEYIKIEKWLKFFRDNAVKDASFIIVGNKLDLINSTYGLKERKEIQLIAQELNSPYFEISVKTGSNVNDAFNTIMNLMLEQIREENLQKKLPFDFTSQLIEDIACILEKKLLDYFSLEEKRRFLQQNVPAILTNIEKVSKHYPNMLHYIFKERLLDYLSPEEKTQLIQQNFPGLLIFVIKITRDFAYDKFIKKGKSECRISDETLCYMYLTVINAIEGTKLMDDFFKTIDESSLFYNVKRIITKLRGSIKKEQKLKQSESEGVNENSNDSKTSDDNWGHIFTVFMNAWDQEINRIEEIKRNNEVKWNKEAKWNHVRKQINDEIKCNNCWKVLPPKSIDILMRKECVYCPNCGILNRRKFSFEVVRAYLEAKDHPRLRYKSKLK